MRLQAGRLFRSGAAEIVVGRSIAERFSGVGLGERLWFGQREWTIVGVIDAGRAGFNSEIWGDAEQMCQAFRRPVYSSVTCRLADNGRFDALKEQLEGDPHMIVEAKRETVYYAEQSEVMAKFIRILGMVLSVIFSLGAIIGAMIAMYASVASRTVEIGTLRALGFRRRGILAAFLAESMLLGLAGGAAEHRRCAAGSLKIGARLPLLVVHFEYFLMMDSISSIACSISGSSPASERNFSRLE